MGAAAGLVAIAVGAIAGWVVMVWVMEASYSFEPLSALSVVVAGIAASLVASVVFILRPLAARPARVLRPQD